MKMGSIPLISDNVLLSGLTTIGLGGPATHYALCENVGQLKECLAVAQTNNWPVQVLGGGSNVIFPDEGFRGLVVKVAFQGFSLRELGEWAEVTVASGYNWDDFVQACIDHNLTGVECLSGIPGCAGATPIQNVGAYGQEVSDTLLSLTAFDRETMKEVKFCGTECGFAYRQSRFKTKDAFRYIITNITFRLQRYARPVIRYPELAKCIDSQVDFKSVADGRPALEAVRKAVLTLRRQKSMVIDPADPHARSCGSFYTNPMLTQAEYCRLKERWEKTNGAAPIPTFPAGSKMKVPAAWLIEKSGFQKGYRAGGVGISAHHALALVNYSGSTRELLSLAREIENRVYDVFGIRLDREPVVISQ